MLERFDKFFFIDDAIIRKFGHPGSGRRISSPGLNIVTKDA
jgi:hypothetical protein